MIIEIDQSGKREALIKNLLLEKMRKGKFDFSAENISFAQIGKRSKAHLLGYAVYKGWRKPDLEVRYKEILKFIAK